MAPHEIDRIGFAKKGDNRYLPRKAVYPVKISDSRRLNFILIKSLLIGREKNNFEVNWIGMALGVQFRPDPI